MNIFFLKRTLFSLLIAFGLVFISDFIGNLVFKLQLSEHLNFNPTKSTKKGSGAPNDVKLMTENRSTPLKVLHPKKKELAILSNVKKGKKVFRKCKACHSINDSEKNGIGPNLWKVYGRKIGSVTKFKYSTPMKNMQGEWNFETLDLFLTHPKQFLKGTKMRFRGISNASERKNLIYYLESQSKL